MKDYVCKYGVVKFVETPWNTRNLGLESLDITHVDADDFNGAALLDTFCESKKNEGYKLITIRIDSLDKSKKKYLYLSGFICVEHTLDVNLFNPNKDNLINLVQRFPMDLVDFSTNDLEKIKNMSGEVFRFGRFFEDPIIEEILATQRQKKWIEDLVKDKAVIRILKRKDDYVGMMAYTYSKEITILNLGGLKREFRHLAYGFWARILLDLSDVRCIHTTISSSNTDIINLYSYFGFQFSNPKYGYHKYL
jgi:hypothetical protein